MAVVHRNNTTINKKIKMPVVYLDDIAFIEKVITSLSPTTFVINDEFEEYKSYTEIEESADPRKQISFTAIMPTFSVSITDQTCEVYAHNPTGDSLTAVNTIIAYLEKRERKVRYLLGSYGTIGLPLGGVIAYFAWIGSLVSVMVIGVIVMILAGTLPLYLLKNYSVIHYKKYSGGFWQRNKELQVGLITTTVGWLLGLLSADSIKSFFQ